MGNFVLWFARLLVKFSSGKSSQIHEEKCQEKYRRKKNQKNSRKSGTKRGKILGDYGNSGRWISPKNPLFWVLFAFRDDWPLWLSKNLIFWAWNPSIFIRIMDLPPKSWYHHRTLRNHQPTDHESTLSTWSIEKSTGQMSPAHWCQLMSEVAWSSDIKNMWIHQRSSQEEFQKTWCGPPLFERPGNH